MRWRRSTGVRSLYLRIYLTVVVVLLVAVCIAVGLAPFVVEPVVRGQLGGETLLDLVFAEHLVGTGLAPLGHERLLR